MTKAEELKKQKDNAYWERNQLVAALSKVFPAWLGKHPKEDAEWEDDWRTIVFIQIPFELTIHFNPQIPLSREPYQLSWHIHDSEIPMFDHLSYEYGFDKEWDGHSTEEKYRRLRLLKLQPRGYVTNINQESTSK